MRSPSVVDWPRQSIPIADVEVVFDRPAFSGPSNPYTRRPQVVLSPAGGWRITYHGVIVHRGNLQIVRALLARHIGRAEPIYVGPYDMLNGPVKRANATSPVLSNFSDGKKFTDGKQWATPIFDCSLSSAVSFGATEIPVTNSVRAPLKAGDFFELDTALHVIESISDTNVWKVWPSMRAAYASGTVLEITDPRMKAYIDLDKAPALRLTGGHWATISIPFVEASWP